MAQRTGLQAFVRLLIKINHVVSRYGSTFIPLLSAGEQNLVQAIQALISYAESQLNRDVE